MSDTPAITDDARRQKIRDTAKKRFKLVTESEQKQREREKDDLRFQVPEQQWDEQAKRQRQGFTDGGTGAGPGIPVPARPMLSISKLDQPLQLAFNQAQEAHLAVQIHALSPDANKDVAEMYEGLYRNIQRNSNAELGRLWGFDRASKCGRGWYRVNTVYDDSGGDEFDQKIVIERVLHQDAVYMDPAAEKPDCSDGEWAFIASWVPKETFNALYPDAELAGADTYEWSSQVTQNPLWVRGAGDQQAVLVAEYFYKEHEREDVKRGGLVRRRDKVTVKWVKLTAVEILEEGDWNGKYIPLIPVIWRELQPYDVERRWTGVISGAKDAQRTFNYAVSSAVERVALEPKAPFIGAEGQFEGHESEWQQANIRNFPYLEYNAKVMGPGGQPLPPPQRAQIDTQGLSVSMQLMEAADGWLQASTAVYDPSLGRNNPRDKSGRAIVALQNQADAGMGHGLRNLADISMRYEARVVLDLIPAVYDRPGRIETILELEGDTSTVMLNQPYAVHAQTKQPVPVNVQQDQQGAPMQPLTPQEPLPPLGLAPGQQPAIKHYDLTKGAYGVAVSVGKSRQTLSQEGAEEIGQILQSAPQLMPILGPVYFRYRDFPGSIEIADLLTKMRDKQFPWLTGGDGEMPPTPEQLQAQNQAQQQQLQLVTAQLQHAMQAIQTEQAKQQASIQKATLDNQTKERIAAADREVKVLLTGLEKRFDVLQALLQHTHEKGQDQFQAAHDVGMASVQAAHDASGVAHQAAVTATLPPPLPTSVGQPLEPQGGGQI